MNEGVPKGKLWFYGVAFALVLLAAASLLMEGLTRTLAASNSLAAIVLSAIAIVLGLVAAKK